MRHIKSSLTAGMLLLSLHVPAHAVDFLYNFGFTFGGEKLGSVSYVGGGTDNFYASQGIDMGLGLELKHGVSEKFATQLMSGFIFGGAGSNGGWEWYNNYVQVVEFMRTSDRARWGVGIISNTSPRAYTYGSLAGLYDLGFANSTGYVILAEINSAYALKGGFAMGLKYVVVQYPVNTFNGTDVSSSGESINGSTLGLYMSWFF